DSARAPARRGGPASWRQRPNATPRRAAGHAAGGGALRGAPGRPTHGPSRGTPGGFALSFPPGGEPEATASLAESPLVESTGGRVLLNGACLLEFAPWRADGKGCCLVGNFDP